MLKHDAIESHYGKLTAKCDLKLKTSKVFFRMPREKVARDFWPDISELCRLYPD